MRYLLFIILTSCSLPTQTKLKEDPSCIEAQTLSQSLYLPKGFQTTPWNPEAFHFLGITRDQAKKALSLERYAFLDEPSFEKLSQWLPKEHLDLLGLANQTATGTYQNQTGHLLSLPRLLNRLETTEIPLDELTYHGIFFHHHYYSPHPPQSLHPLGGLSHLDQLADQSFIPLRSKIWDQPLSEALYFFPLKGTSTLEQKIIIGEVTYLYTTLSSLQNWFTRRPASHAEPPHEVFDLKKVSYYFGAPLMDESRPIFHSKGMDIIPLKKPSLPSLPHLNPPPFNPLQMEILEELGINPLALKKLLQDFESPKKITLADHLLKPMGESTPIEMDLYRSSYRQRPTYRLMLTWQSSLEHPSPTPLPVADGLPFLVESPPIREPIWLPANPPYQLSASLHSVGNSAPNQRWRLKVEFQRASP